MRIMKRSFCPSLEVTPGTLFCTIQMVWCDCCQEHKAGSSGRKKEKINMKPAVYFQCVVSSVKLCNLGAQIVAQAEKWLHAMLSFNQRSLFVLLFQISATSALPCCNSPAHHPLPPLFLPHHLIVLASPALPSSLLLLPPHRPPRQIPSGVRLTYSNCPWLSPPSPSPSAKTNWEASASSAARREEAGLVKPAHRRPETWTTSRSTRATHTSPPIPEAPESTGG